jgi:hypothetical protein
MLKIGQTGFAENTDWKTPSNLVSGGIGLNALGNYMMKEKGMTGSWPTNETFISRVFAAIPSYGRKFSLGLRLPSLGKGFVSFGGVPKPDLHSNMFRFEKEFTNVTLDWQDPDYYWVQPSRITVCGAKSLPKPERYVLHSGLANLALAEDVVQHLNTFISPPPYQDINGKYMVDCNATIRDEFAFEVSFGKMKWGLPKERVILQDSEYNPGGNCSSALQVLSHGGLNRVLGTPFLVDFVTTFDLDAKRVYFQKWLP